MSSAKDTKPRRSEKKAATENVAEVKVPISWRDPVVTSAMLVLTLVIALVAKGKSDISFAGASGWFNAGTWTLDASISTWVMTIVAAFATGVVWNLALKRKKVSGWLLATVAVSFVVSFLILSVADRPSAQLPVVSLLAGGLMFATPLVFGALAGVINERVGVINIAIEGQLLLGAFAGVVVGSVTKNAWLGLIGAAAAGSLLAVLLALFTINYRSNHIVVGVVLNMLALGITSFLFTSQLSPNPNLNQIVRLPKIKIPVLADIPIVGPVLFNQSVLVYMMYAAVIILQIMLFQSRWGLRLRSVGEKPSAADTVGINVNRTRWRNVLLGGAVAGMGGAFFTLGQGLAFSKDMAAGNGFIALAAMILGRWNPVGALGAALLFGFATNLGAVMQVVNAPVPAEYLLMIPYLVTVLAVAGFVGAVRPPAAEGKPYP